MNRMCRLIVSRLRPTSAATRLAEKSLEILIHVDVSPLPPYTANFDPVFEAGMAECKSAPNQVPSVRASLQT